MEKFSTHTGIGVPLRQSNVDTDQITPGEYLKRIARTGFEDALFAGWRKDPAFILNQEPFNAGSVLVAGPEFGTGSSREHAVWALKDYGFKTVLSSRFADIFRSNSGKQGLLAAEVAQDDIELIWKVLENAPGTEVTVDLVSKTVICGNVVAPFEIDDYTRWRLLEGLDDIGLTLRHEEAITAYEATRHSFKPKTLPARLAPGPANFPTGTVEPDYELMKALDPDPASVFDGLGSEDRAYRDRARAFVQEEVLPVIAGYWERGEYPLHLVRRLGQLDLLRDGVPVEGFAPMSKMAAGLVNMEISRGDGSIGTVIAVQGGLALRSIALCGSDEQKRRLLPALARGEVYGAFALTEPTHGSDSVGLETTALPTVGGFVLNGEKKWIGNGSVGGLTVVWARAEDGQVHGYLVPQESPGYRGTTIEGKSSLRAIWQAHIRLEDVFVPTENVLPDATSFKDASRVLLATRLGVAWSAVGHATACYETAVQYTAQRKQFGRPLAAAQIVQERLARMYSELATMQLIVVQMTRLDEAGTLTPVQASLAKYTCTRTARSIASNSRDLLGGNGILLANRVARHMADIEALHTYEGTETVQALIIGRSITGISAFA